MHVQEQGQDKPLGGCTSETKDYERVTNVAPRPLDERSKKKAMKENTLKEKGERTTNTHTRTEEEEGAKV